MTIDLQLRPVLRDDAMQLYAWRQEPSIQIYNPLDDLSFEQVRDGLSAVSSDLSDRSFEKFRWMVEHKDEVIGSVAISGVRWRMGYGELGYGIAEKHHGMGFGGAAVKIS